MVLKGRTTQKGPGRVIASTTVDSLSDNLTENARDSYLNTAYDVEIFFAIAVPSAVPVDRITAEQIIVFAKCTQIRYLQEPT